MEQSPAIIDDVEAAISKLTPLGQSVVGPVARQVRDAIVVYAAMRQWRLVQYHAMVNWAMAHVDKTLLWIVLDPLFPIDDLDCRALAVRATRAAGPAGWELTLELEPHVRAAVAGQRVGLLDDVASNGRTFRHISKEVMSAGGVLASFMVGASTARARESLAVEIPNALWSQCLTGDHPTIHLRDGCPCLPFAGKRSSELSPVNTKRGLLGVRIPPTAFRGGLWDQLGSDRFTARAMIAARRELVQRFSFTLGRAPTVADVFLLGANVEIPLYATSSANADSLLESVLC